MSCGAVSASGGGGAFFLRERAYRGEMAAVDHGRRHGAAQIAIFALALLAYQIVRGLTIGDARDAFVNAIDLIRLQDAAGLAVEPSVQAWAFARDPLAQVASLAYLGLHLPVTAVFFVWLWRRRRTAYVPVRNVFLAANGLALVVYALYPVAPPRLVAASGLEDGLRTTAGVDLHGGLLAGLFNPYAAVPSMHVAYAALIGWVVWRVADIRLLRLAGAAYPVVIVFTVVATGNHYVLDAIAGIGILLGGIVVVRLVGLPWRLPADARWGMHPPAAAR